jgi:hypothetical protein
MDEDTQVCKGWFQVSEVNVFAQIFLGKPLGGS